MKNKTAICCLLMFVSFLTFAADRWNTLTEQSFVNFTARSAFGKVYGKITDLKAEIIFSENELEKSSFKASVTPGTIDTDNHKRDKHLKSDDYLDIAKYPSIKFVSKKITRTSAGYEVTGDLTIKDVTKEISFPFTFQREGTKGTFKGSFGINRRDYHVGEETKMMGDNVDIEIVAVAEIQG